MRATRDGFGKALAEAGDSIDFYLLGADLSKATKAYEFAKKFPQRYFECGISEMNMIGVSAGLASQGNKVVISSFGSFLTGRYDQIRCSIAMPKLPVLLVGTHEGLSPSLDGPTQSAYEDIALMRALGIPIYNLSSATQVEQTLPDILRNLKEPVYLRLGRQPVKDIEYTNQHLLYSGPLDHLVIFTGSTADLATEVSNTLPNSKIYAVNLIDKGSAFNIATAITSTRPKKVITIEDHSVRGGLGSLVAEAVAKYVIWVDKPKFHSFGIKEFPGTGRPEDIYKAAGLTAEDIVRKVNEY